VMVCRGGETESVYFFHSLSNSLTRSVFTELTEFDQVWSSLTEFDHFRVFNSILHVICELTRKIVRFYESTRVLTTMVGGLDFSFYLKNNSN